MGAFVYILHCADDSYYVGSARGDDLDKRFYEHQTGALGGYTSTRRPVRTRFPRALRSHHRRHLG